MTDVAASMAAADSFRGCFDRYRADPLIHPVSAQLVVVPLKVQLDRMLASYQKEILKYIATLQVWAEDDDEDVSYRTGSAAAIFLQKQIEEAHQIVSGFSVCVRVNAAHHLVPTDAWNDEIQRSGAISAAPPGRPAPSPAPLAFLAGSSDLHGDAWTQDPAIALPAMGATPVIRGRPPENDLERMHVEGGGELGVRVVDLQENVYERSRFIRKDVLELLKHVQCKVNETLCDNLPKLQVPPTPQGQETVARMITSAADWTTTSVCFVMYMLDLECS